MTDINLPSSMPVPRPETSPYPSYLQQFFSGAAYLFSGIRHHVLGSVETVPLPAIGSPWDLLMASTPVDFYHTAVSTAEKLSRQNGALIRTLLELAPRPSKYPPTQHGKLFGVRGHYLPVSIGFNDKQPLYFISAAEATSSTFRHSCVETTLPPMVPTILVTDVDGPQPSGTYCYLDESYKAMSSGGGFLWREWRGKFSPSQNRYGSGDQTYFEGVPPARIEMVEVVEVEVEVEVVVVVEAEHWATRHIEFQEEVCWGSEDQVKVTNLIPEENSKPKELEWWETEEGDDGGGNFEEESDLDLNDEEEDEEDEEDDSEFSGSEDGDDEYEDDSQDDDSGEDSDLEEESDRQPTHNVLPLIAGHHLSALATPTPTPSSTQSELNFPIKSLAGELGSCQDIQDTQSSEGSHGGGNSPQSSSPSSPYLSVADSGFESCNSSMTMSSLSPTPITPPSPSLIPFDTYTLRKREWGRCNDDCKSSSLQLSETSWGLAASLDLELGAVRRAGRRLDGVSPGEGVIIGGTPSMEALDLAGWSHQNS